jgi:hypothetical protein
VKGEVLVGSFKESTTILRQAKKEGEMLENSQGPFHPFEHQSPSYPRYLFLPPLTPVLKTLIRDLWASDSFAAFLIGLPLASVPEEAFHYFQRLRDSLAEKRRQESKGSGAGFAQIAFYPNCHLPTPSFIKAMASNFVSSSAIRTALYYGEVVIFSPFSIILDRDAKIVYDHPCMEEALEGILSRINITNPDYPSGAFLFIRDLSK